MRNRLIITTEPDGRRIIRHPGLIYPEDATEQTPSKPAWATYNPETDIKLEEIAKLFNSSRAAASHFLKVRKLKYKKVVGKKSGICKAYSRKTILKLLAERPTIHTRIPFGYITAKEAIEILDTSRSGLRRAVLKGEIEAKEIRLKEKGKMTRTRTIYRKGEIIKAAKSGKYISGKFTPMEQIQIQQRMRLTCYSTEKAAKSISATPEDFLDAAKACHYRGIEQQGRTYWTPTQVRSIRRNLLRRISRPPRE